MAKIRPPFFSRYVFSLLLAMLTMVALYGAFGFYWEDSMKVHPALAYGCITEPPYEAWIIESFLFLAPPLSFLSTVFPGVAVVGVWFAFLLTLQFSLWYFFTLRLFLRLGIINPLHRIATAIVFVITITGIAQVYIHVSSISLLLISASLLLYSDFYITEGKAKNVFLLPFVLGSLVRVSSGVMLAALMCLWLLVYFKNFRKMLAAMKIFIVAAASLFSVVVINKAVTNNPEKVIEQTYEYALMDKHARLPISTMKHAQDSMRYIALTQFFMITDSAQINLSFIKRVTDIKKISVTEISGEDINHLREDLFPLLNQYWLVLLISYILVILSVSSWKKTGTAVFIFQAAGWLVVLGISLKVGMYTRFLLPWISFLTGGSLLLISFLEKEMRQAKTVLLTGFLLVSATNTLWHVKEISIQENNYNNNAAKYLENLKKLVGYTVPFVWDYRQESFPTQIFSREKLSVFKNTIYQTAFFNMYYASGQKRCLQKFGFSPLDWKKMGIVLNKKHNEVCFVMEASVAEFISVYYKSVYGINFNLKKQEPAVEIFPDNFVFQLSNE